MYKTYTTFCGTTLYVSKLGNNTDGSCWANAFTTVHAALNAIPDDRGGHRIVIRPDTYFEAMLYPVRKGAEGSYNELIGDVDGSLGSGTTGWVVIDSGDPEQGGFKSYDWWGPIRAYSHAWSPEHTEPTFSAIGWDRWKLRNLYVTGGDDGLFFDLTDQVKPFTVIVEDCIGIGRAFGGGVANCLSRHEAPFVWKGRLGYLECVRPASGGTASDYYLLLKDAETGRELARCAEGYGLASLLLHKGTFYVFASKWNNSNWRDVTLFKSSDLQHWESKVVLEGENEGIFNTSVCQGPDGFVMAYESNDPAYPPFTVKIAHSSDLEHWTKVPIPA